MTKLIKNKVILLIIILGIFIIFSEAFALETAWPPSPLGTQLTDQSQLSELVRYFYEWGIALGGLAAFIALIMAGFSYLTSVGEPAKMKEAQDRISSAFLGLILLLSSWLILNAINPQLTVLRPIALDLEAVFTSCKVDADCPEKDYQCREGICVPIIKKMAGEPCTAVLLYKGYNFIDPLFYVHSEERCESIQHVEVRSVRGAIGSPGKEKLNENCGGLLKFYETTRCREFVGSSPPTNKEIHFDREVVRGVRLFSAF